MTKTRVILATAIINVAFLESSYAPANQYLLQEKSSPWLQIVYVVGACFAYLGAGTCVAMVMGSRLKVRR